VLIAFRIPLFRIVFALLGAALWASATGFAAELPRKIRSVEGVTEYQLDNGLRILTVPAPGEDLLTVHITYLVGSRHEGYGEKGMAHLLEHLLFRGSTRHPRVKDEFARRGARWNATTAYDRTNYFETLPATDENLDWALGMEADRMVNAFVAKSDLESEMTVVRNELEMGENSPGNVLFERMQRLAFAWHNYGNPIIGVRSDIERVPIERLQAFYRTWYRPDNAVLIVAGRFDEPSALERVAQHFGAIPRPTQPAPRLYTSEPTQDGERAVTLRRTGDTPFISAMYRVPAAGHPDYAAVDVLVGVLGATPSGRLHRALVQPGLASFVWASERGLHDPGFVYLGAGLAKTASFDAARDALLHTVEDTDAVPITDDEVARSKRALLNDFETTRTETSSLVRALSEFSAIGDWRLFFLYRDRLRAVSVEDVSRVARTYLKAANRVLGTFVPTPKPDRARIPETPDLMEALAGYRGGDEIEAGEPFDPSPENIEARVIRKSLRNDIRVALLPKKTRGSRVVASLTLHWGDEASRKGRDAACSLAGGMLTRGTDRRSRSELRDAFDRLNASVSLGMGGASIEVRRGELAETMRLVAEALRESSFPKEEFEELKRASLTRIESMRSDPGAIADLQLARHLRPYAKGHPLHAQTIDEELHDMRSVSREDALRCYRGLLGATGAEFAAVGDFDPDELVTVVERLLGDWKSPHPYTRVAARHFERPARERQFSIPDKANAVLRGGLNIEMRNDHPDYPALLLADFLLGGSATARIPARVREKEGLSYSAYTSFSASPLDPVADFRVSAIFAPQNRERVERAIREEIARAVREGFTAAEVEAGRSGLLKARRLSRTRDGVLANRLASYLFLQRTFAWDEAFEDRIAKLSPEDVSAALRRYVDPSRLSVMVAGDFR
jgi:zinc protease